MAIHNKKDLIMETALKLFKEKGFEETSISDICRAADISRSSFYFVFQDKNEIIHEIYRQVVASGEDLTMMLLSAENDIDRIWALAVKYIIVWEDFGPEMCSVLCRLDLKQELDWVHERRRAVPWFVPLVRSAQKAGLIRNQSSPEELSLVLVGAFSQACYEWCRSRGAFPFRPMARKVMETVLDVDPSCRWDESRYEEIRPAIQASL